MIYILIDDLHVRPVQDLKCEGLYCGFSNIFLNHIKFYSRTPLLGFLPFVVMDFWLPLHLGKACCPYLLPLRSIFSSPFPHITVRLYPATSVGFQVHFSGVNSTQARHTTTHTHTHNLDIKPPLPIPWLCYTAKQPCPSIRRPLLPFVTGQILRLWHLINFVFSATAETRLYRD